MPPSRRLTLEYVSKVALTDAIQDYLKEIYKLQSESGPTSVSALARRQGVSPASASAMVKKLAALELADHQPYGGVVLTASGERVAIEIIRHHRLLELYLAESLDMPWDRVHDEAEVLEHHLSEELEQLIAAKLGNPTRDPHGDPIPTAELVIDEADRLEHVISEELEARIDRALGFPTHDPHGDPIPDAQLKWPRSSALG